MTPYDPLTTSTKCLAIAPVIHMTVIRMPVIHMTVISGVLIVSVTIAVIPIIDAFHIDRRAAIALSEAACIAEETRSARIFFLIVVWISAAIMIMGGAAAALVFFGALAYRSIDALRAPRNLYYPQMGTAPEVSPGLNRGPRQETLTSPQSSTISEFVQDKSGQEIRNR